MKIKENINRNIFRGYDIRGVYPTEIDADTAYTIGLGFGSYIKSIGKTTCVLGHDNRLSGEELYNALSTGILETGIDIISLGLCTTPMYYYACIKFGDEEYYHYGENINNDYRKTMCNKLLKELEVKDYNLQPKVYITKYNLESFKNYVEADTNYATFSGGFSDYVNFLPMYRVPSLNDAAYRVLIEFDRNKNGLNYTTYATIEVKK